MGIRPVPDTNWGGSCPDLMPRALWLTLLAMLAHPLAMIRFIRTGEEPK